MNFEEWYESTLQSGNSGGHHLVAKFAWNAAIDEALKIVDNSVSKSCVGITAKLKELKE